MKIIRMMGLDFKTIKDSHLAIFKEFPKSNLKGLGAESGHSRA